MPERLSPVRFTGATILRDGALQRRSLAIAEGRITRGPLPEVNLEGYLILPGIVDLHGAGLDGPQDPAGGLAAADRAAAQNGVTTAWLAQGWSWEGGRQDPDHAESVLAALDARRDRLLTDLRIQIRCETHTVETGARLLAAIRRHGVGYVVFNNHLDAAAEIADTRPDDLARRAERAGHSLDAYGARIGRARAMAREVPRHLCRLADAFDECGLLYGSHDDPDGETRERFSMIGARIAEFPATRRAAAAARAMGDPVVLDAGGVMPGGTHEGRVSATDLLAMGLGDALASRRDFSAPARAAWRLADIGARTLPQAWAMISDRPAQIMRLPDRGRLDVGRRADLCVVNARTRAVELTIADGRLVHATGEAARRLSLGAGLSGMAAE